MNHELLKQAIEDAKAVNRLVLSHPFSNGDNSIVGHKGVTITEISPLKFSRKLKEIIEDGWELLDISTSHQSGFTAYTAKLNKKYETY